MLAGFAGCLHFDVREQRKLYITFFLATFAGGLQVFGVDGEQLS